jgi:hypothetical protein
MMQCLRCGYQWLNKKLEPKQCPHCKQYYYSKEKGWKFIEQPAEQETKEEFKEEPKEQPIKRRIVKLD